MNMEESGQGSKKCLVIGGCGFLGSHIVEKLVQSGYRVSIFDIRKNFEDGSIPFFLGDLCCKEDLLPALEGIDIVFHCATPPPLSHNKQLFKKVNVDGTKHLIELCLEAGVKKMVLTSSASVVYQGKDIVNGTEELPYAKKPMDHYTATKILQEKLVLEANSENFCTVAIRPHGIFGPRDPHMVPTTVKMARLGKTKYIIGNGKNTVDFTHVDNVVLGHVLASEHLYPTSPVCGKAYNITNDEPILFWKFMTEIITGLGYSAPSKHIPYWLIYMLAVILQFLCFLIRPIKDIRPTFSPMTVALAGTDHFYSCERAKEDLGYKPVISMEDGILDTLMYFDHLKKPEIEENNREESKINEVEKTK